MMGFLIFYHPMYKLNSSLVHSIHLLHRRCLLEYDEGFIILFVGLLLMGGCRLNTIDKTFYHCPYNDSNFQSDTLNYHQISTPHLSSYPTTMLPYNSYPFLINNKYIRIYQIALTMKVSFNELTLINYSIVHF